MDPVRVTIGNESTHERRDVPVFRHRPDGIQRASADGIAALGSIDLRGAGAAR